MTILGVFSMLNMFSGHIFLTEINKDFMKNIATFGFEYKHGLPVGIDRCFSYPYGYLDFCFEMQPHLVHPWRVVGFKIDFRIILSINKHFTQQALDVFSNLTKTFYLMILDSYLTKILVFRHFATETLHLYIHLICSLLIFK